MSEVWQKESKFETTFFHIGMLKVKIDANYLQSLMQNLKYLFYLCNVGISSDPDSGTMFLAQNFTHLMSMTSDIVNAVCNGKFPQY